MPVDRRAKPLLGEFGESPLEEVHAFYVRFASARLPGVVRNRSRQTSLSPPPRQLFFDIFLALQDRIVR